MIDDWVFICLLFGNDFLPKSPSIDFYGTDITMNRLLELYTKHLKETGTYLKENGEIRMNQLINFLKKISVEDHRWKYLRNEYYTKFNDPATKSIISSLEVVMHYVRGLCWIFQYYAQGAPSWN